MIFRFVRFIRSLFLLKRRRAEDEQRQKAAGYSITFSQHGPERSITYCEGEREIVAIEEFSAMNDVILYTDSLRRWSRPYNEPVSDFDYQKILNRLVQYYSCWGGEVRLDDRRLPTAEDLKAELEMAGIEYEELPDGIIRYSADAEKVGKLKGGFFNR